MRSPESLVNRGEESRKVSVFSHRERDARRMQHVGADVSVGGNQRACSNQRYAERAQKLPRGIHHRLIGHGGVRQRVNDHVLHADIQQGDGRQRGEQRDGRILARIVCFARNEQRRLKSSVGVDQQDARFEPVRRRGLQRGWIHANDGIQRQRQQPSAGERGQQDQLGDREEIVQPFAGAYPAIVHHCEEGDQQEKNQCPEKSCLDAWKESAQVGDEQIRNGRSCSDSRQPREPADLDGRKGAERLARVQVRPAGFLKVGGHLGQTRRDHGDSCKRHKIGCRAEPSEACGDDGGKPENTSTNHGVEHQRRQTPPADGANQLWMFVHHSPCCFPPQKRNARFRSKRAPAYHASFLCRAAARHGCAPTRLALACLAAFRLCYNSFIVMASNSALFPRNFRKDYPIAVRGEGCWIMDQSGRRFLDASGQAAVVSIGHGVAEIGRAMAEQCSRIAFAHTTQFHSEPAEKLARRLLALAPPSFRDGRVYFTSGGSEATETAIKLSRQFHLESGQSSRYRVVSRRQSYHGSTLGAMTVSGNIARRAPYQPLLAEWGHVAPCFCYHCPFGKTFPDCATACADDLDNFLSTNDAASVAAFIFEPVVGATLGAAVPPDGYTQRIAKICRDRGILLIADEIMSGMGRTGKPFAVQHWNVEPDIILVGKGIASGYAPLGAVLIAPRVVEAFERGSGAFQHGFTYQAHPVATAAGNAVLDYIEAHRLFDRVPPAADGLRQELSALESHPNVGEIRGLGLLVGIEFVVNKSTRDPFPRESNIAERIRQAALVQNVLTYPTQGCVDGINGDHILLAPPFIISSQEYGLIASALHSPLQKGFPT